MGVMSLSVTSYSARKGGRGGRSGLGRRAGVRGARWGVPAAAAAVAAGAAAAAALTRGRLVAGLALDADLIDLLVHLRAVVVAHLRSRGAGGGGARAAAVALWQAKPPDGQW